MGFFYFAGGYLTTLFLPANPVALLLSMLAVPYVFFSVYYQWRVAKQWCTLCLAVQILLVAGTVNILASNLTTLIVTTQLSLIAPSLFIYLLPVLLWFMIKPVLKKISQSKEVKRGYNRFKFNPQVFTNLLKEQKKIIASPEGLGIIMGNTSAKHELIKVCNPYCGPCAAEHSRIEQLLGKTDDIKVRIIFTATLDEKDYRKEATRHLMAIADTNDEPAVKKALHDWYGRKDKQYEMFAKKWPMNGELKQQDEKLKQMSEWCTKSEIQLTPTYFLNGHQLPNAYNISDIEYFLLE